MVGTVSFGSPYVGAGICALTMELLQVLKQLDQN